MNKTIIAVYGRYNEGKSDTLKKVCQTILSTFPTAEASQEDINYEHDILLTIQLPNLKIGIESKGDPNSRMLTEDTIKSLADENCDIILCATRTSGDTTYKVDEIADNYGYHTLWISSFWSPKLDYSVLNQKAAENVIDIIKSLAIGQL